MEKEIIKLDDCLIKDFTYDENDKTLSVGYKLNKTKEFVNVDVETIKEIRKINNEGNCIALMIKTKCQEKK